MSSQLQPIQGHQTPPYNYYLIYSIHSSHLSRTTREQKLFITYSTQIPRYVLKSIGYHDIII